MCNMQTKKKKNVWGRTFHKLSAAHARLQDSPDQGPRFPTGHQPRGCGMRGNRRGDDGQGDMGKASDGN